MPGTESIKGLVKGLLIVAFIVLCVLGGLFGCWMWIWRDGFM